MTVNDCARFLRDRDDYVILTHQRPDGDTLGCGGALCSALRRLGKRAALHPNPDITEHYLGYVGDYFGDGSGATVVSVDVAEEKLFPKGFAGTVDLAIDHHPSNSGFAARTLLRPEKASCGEIVLEVIEALGQGVTGREADLLYMALSTDCGCFQYANTKAETHLAAAKLMDYGADTPRLNKDLFRSASPVRLRLEGAIYSTMRSYREGQITLVMVTRALMAQCGATEDDCDDLAGLAGRARGNRVSITIREQPDGSSRCSLRTDGSVDAMEVCAHFGGGGHRMASGCNAPCGPEELARAVLELVEARLK